MAKTKTRRTSGRGVVAESQRMKPSMFPEVPALAVSRGMAVIGRADASGLGSLTVDFCREMRPERVMIINCSSRGATDVGRITCADVQLVEMEKVNQQVVSKFLDGMKYVVGFETFYRTCVMEAAGRMGIHTVLVPMWECTQPEYEICDTMICVSDQDLRHYHDGVRIDWPMNPGAFFKPEALHRPATRFQHNAGTFGLNGRNNTEGVALAAQMLMGEIDLKIRAVEKPDFRVPTGVNIEVGAIDRAGLYFGYDVLVFPIGMSGLCLPIQEAAALGLPTVVMDLPQWAAWPAELKLPSVRVDTLPIGGRAVEYHRFDPAALASLLRRIAKGEVFPAQPPPQPSWGEFRRSWEAKVMSRL